MMFSTWHIVFQFPIQDTKDLALNSTVQMVHSAYVHLSSIKNLINPGA